MRSSRAGKLHIGVLGERQPRNAILRFVDKRSHRTPQNIASDGLHAAGTPMQDDVTCRRLVNIGELPESDVNSIGTSDRQGAYFPCLGAISWRQNHVFITRPT